MQKTLLLKLLAISGLSFLLLAALLMIEGLIDEREGYRNQVIRDISESWTGRQLISGPVIIQPYEEISSWDAIEYIDGEQITVKRTGPVQKYKVILPEEMEVTGEMITQTRYRGIHEVPVYSSALNMSGRFQLEKDLGLALDGNRITLQKPFVMMGISDIRGIQRDVRLVLEHEQLELMPGTRLKAMPQGVHASLEDLMEEGPRDILFSASMDLNGMEAFHVLPTGKFTSLDLMSAWPHPRFEGRFLPKDRQISEEGFSARWESSLFASNVQQNMENCVGAGYCEALFRNHFGVALDQGVDIYQKSDRSVKYALLFIGLTFIAFFLFEVMKGLRIHAIQYGLVGFALSLFYLLLISLSEHLAFWISYVIAAGACISLLAFYVSYVLKSWRRGALFAGMLAGLYGALYMLVRSEDYALLMGSALLFTILGGIMVLTRHVDWYAIENNAKQSLVSRKQVPAEQT